MSTEYTPPVSTTFPAIITATAFSASGIAGATSGARFVGATASSAPVAGTFSVGDFIVARNGHMWVCTVAGSPGTWLDVGLGGGTFASAVSAQYFAALGLTGATAVSRYVGATNSGAPVAGTFAVGDYAVARDGAIYICTVAGTPGTWVQVGSTIAGDLTITGGNLILATAGKGLNLKEGGAAARQGLAVLVGGTLVVNTTAVTANSRIQLTAQVLGTVAAPKALCVSARTPGTSFTILSADATDTSSVAWVIIEPS